MGVRLSSGLCLAVVYVCLATSVHGIWLEASSAESTADAPAPAAAVYNLRVISDASPDLTDFDSFLQSTTSRWETPEQKVWALFYWAHILKRQTAPIVLHGLEVTDPIRNFGDYGFTMCSTITGINQSLYEALGLRHQYWDICNHTVSQVEWDGRFHMIDSSMSHLVTTDDGVTLASLQEAAADSARLVKERSLYSTSPNGFLTGTDASRSLPDVVNPTTGTVSNGFGDAFCATGLKYRDYYYNWDRGHRYVLNLREDESYTRYYRRLGSGPEYWVGTENVNVPDPTNKKELDSTDRFGLRGNGRWTFTPKLTADGWAAAAYRSANIVAAGGGLQPAVAGAVAEVIYKVQAANAITSQQVRAEFSRMDAAAQATIAVSLNHGLTWRDVATLGAETGFAVPLAANLRDEVSAAYETLVRVQMTAPAGSVDTIRLTGLTIETITQVNAKALPKLNVGRNEIFLTLGEQSDTMSLWPELRGDYWKNDVYDSRNIASQSVSVPRKYTALAYPAVLNQDAYLVYRMDAPTDISSAVYGGRLHNYSSGSYIEFQHSFDLGATWVRSYRLTDIKKPYDVLHYETITDVPAGVRTILFKYVIHNTNTTTARASGLYSARMEVHHGRGTPVAKPVDVTLRWKEVGANRLLTERSHRQRINEFPFKYVINVGGSDHPVMESMRLSLADDTDATPFGYSDGVDAGGEKYVYRKQIDGANLAKERAYTVSRAPSGFQGSMPATNTTILTDGVVGAPATGGNAYWWGQCWTSGAEVALQVDLGQVQSVGAVRAHLFGYPFWDALKGQVQDRVEILTSPDGITFTSQGLLNTSLWKKDIPINHMLQDDEKATAWNFGLIFPAAVNARYVKYRVTPKRSLCISELQVLDRIETAPFDIRIAPPAVFNIPVPPPNVAPTVTLTAPANGTAVDAPATVTVSADASDTDGSVSRVEFFANGALIGERTEAPWSIVWADVAAGTYTLTARAIDDRGESATSTGTTLIVNTPAPPIDAPPVVTITAPASGTTADAPATIAIDAEATDIDGVITRVEFFANGALIGERTAAPWSMVWSSVPEGTYALTARAVDDRGEASTSTDVVVRVNAPPPPPNVPPAVSITAPAADVTVDAPASMTVEAHASDTDGSVTRVEFFANDVAIGERTEAPWSITWADVGEGTYTLTARATDDRGDPTTSAAVHVTVVMPPSDPPPPIATKEVVLYAKDAAVGGGWAVTPDTTAAGGARLQNPNAGAARVSAPLASPTAYFEMPFTAYAGVGYRLWIRGKAISNYWGNDAVFVQFDDAVTQAGAPVYRIGTTSGTTYQLEDCSNCGLSGWGWQDNAYNTTPGSVGPLIYFATTGQHTLRVQVREDGLGIDQIVLSAERFLTTAPGAVKNDTTILPLTDARANKPPSISLTAPLASSVWTAPATITVEAAAADQDGVVTRVEFFANGMPIGARTSAPWSIAWKDVSAGTYAMTARATDDRGAMTTSAELSVSVGTPTPTLPGTKEVVLYARDGVIAAGWTVTTDATAAGGARMQNPNAGAAKVSGPQAAPSAYFQMSFTAQAGIGYRLWMRGKATSNSWANDAVYVQFDGSVDQAGAPVYRIGTTSGTSVQIEDCVNCGLSGWGWQDNGYGNTAGMLGPLVYFATSGPQTLRVQVREDGLGIDQIVLSAERFLQTAPGATKNDTTIVLR